MWTLIIIMLLLWLVGVITSYTLGGFINILLGIALVLLIIRLFKGGRTNK